MGRFTMRSICGKLADYRGIIGRKCVNINKHGFIESVTSIPRYPDVVKFDYSKFLIVPGFIDIHVHLRDFELSYKEDIVTAARSAVSAGITLVIDMPNTRPFLNTHENLSKRFSELKRKSLADYSVYAGVPYSADELTRILRLPIAGVKVYPNDLGKKHEIISSLTKSEVLIILHPELPEAEKPVLESVNSIEAHRGCFWEYASLNYFSEIYKPKKLHVTHVSCASTIILAKKYNYTVDVTPHHLLLDLNQKNSSNECLMKVNPPIRSHIERTRIFNYLLEDNIDAIASDHAPHHPKEKIDPLSCAPGIPWLEHWPSIVFCLVKAKILSLFQFLRLVVQGPARVLGLENIYGRIDRGFRANLSVIEPSEYRVYNIEFSKAKNIPYEKWTSCMEVHKTIIGGVIVYDEGTFLEKPEPINPFSLLDMSN